VVGAGHPSLKNNILPGSSACRQISISVPRPTLQIAPFFSRSRPCIMDLQVGDTWFGKAVSNRSPLGKYLAFNNLEHRLSGNSIRRQACLASSAWLKSLMSLNPRAVWIVTWPISHVCISLKEIWMIQCVRYMLSFSSQICMPSWLSSRHSVSAVILRQSAAHIYSLQIYSYIT